MGVVSRTPNLKQIQGELADMLCLKFHEESDSGRAHRLYARLKNEKKILIILDDVWAILDLDSIGIPFGVDHKACRILVTTQNECVCSTMGAQTRKIPLNVLSEGDSWALFRRILGEVVDSPRFNAVARDVVEECGGFPLMLVKIGRSLRGKTLEEWKDLCRQLKKSRALNKKKRWTKTLCLMSIIDFILKLRFLLFFYILSACTCLIEFNIMLYPKRIHFNVIYLHYVVFFSKITYF